MEQEQSELFAHGRQGASGVDLFVEFSNLGVTLLCLKSRVANGLSMRDRMTKFGKVSHGGIICGNDWSSNYLAFHDVHSKAFHLRGMQTNGRTFLVGRHDFGNMPGNDVALHGMNEQINPRGII